MKIGSTPDSHAAAEAALRGASRAPGGPAVASVVAADRVALSSAGTQLGGVDGTQEFDTAKVDAIRQAIREGRFTVDPGAIADRLIADAAALLGPRAS